MYDDFSYVDVETKEKRAYPIIPDMLSSSLLLAYFSLHYYAYNNN